ncbi:hypothetical protein Cgig2_011903 [Carnegiea gigantea]|uniref:FAR1 domain-containing protein n=1 Tax=Carnegiea gigantea TaxID=171969 RepID=A0A9Q1JT43_9CARY|nr:hypothetical protein Cgig2_011903 [Carnegiea gigantea]
MLFHPPHTKDRLILQLSSNIVMFLTFNSGPGMEGVDPMGIVDETQCVQDIMDDIVTEEKQNEGTSWNFIDKRLDDHDENNMKKLIFKTPVECEVFYLTYAKAVGFGARREALRMNRHGIVTSLRFCCDREGVRSEKDKNRGDKKRKARDETRCFCKAFISIKYMKIACQHIVKEFKKEHNHHLVPPQQATYHPHVDVDKLDDDTLVVDWVTFFIGHIGFDSSEVLNNLKTLIKGMLCKNPKNRPSEATRLISNKTISNCNVKKPNALQNILTEPEVGKLGESMSPMCCNHARVVQRGKIEVSAKVLKPTIIPPIIKPAVDSPAIVLVRVCADSVRVHASPSLEHQVVD